MKNKFKVGDLVEIKSWEEMEEEYGLNKSGEIKCNKVFAHEMKKFCGKHYTIKQIHSDGGVIFVNYDMDVDGIWHFSTHMIKPVQIITYESLVI